MGRHENMIGATAAVPKRELRRDKINCGGDEGACVADGGEAINGAEVARDINGDEEEVRLRWIESPDIATQQRSVNGHLRREQVAAAALLR